MKIRVKPMILTTMFLRNLSANSASIESENRNGLNQSNGLSDEEDGE